MRDDQRKILEARRERLIDLLIEESKPDEWPKPFTVQGRGDLVWFKRGASGTALLVLRIDDILRRQFSAAERPAKDSDEEVTADATAGVAALDELIENAGAKVRRIIKNGKKG